MKTITELMQEAHQTAVEKGWWESGDRNFCEQIALMHSELSEVLEEYRAGGMDRPFLYSTIRTAVTGEKEFVMLPNGDKPEGIAAEFADVLVRIFDTCERYQIPLVEALDAKMAYNKSRPYRHGNKKA